MPKQEQVEDFKITPEMKNFAKTYRNFNKIGQRLRSKMEIQLGEANQTRQMLQQIEKGMQLLLQDAPQKPTFEVEGQGEMDQAPQQDEMGQMMQEGMGQQTMNPGIQY
jgi:hypothetical protein